MNEDVTVNKSGQSLGRKGRRTRANIVAGANQLLREAPFGALTVAAIAKQAEISAPTFYLYFEDMGEVLLAMLDDVNQDLEGVLAMLTKPWPADRTYTCALEFVHAYFDLWFQHGPVLRARNSMADQGDARFRASRHEGAVHFADALAHRFRDIHRTDSDDVITARGVGGIVITALERLATVVALEFYAPGTVNWEDSSKALAHIIAESVDPALRTPR
jgi:AcrR family transcriptional regulator